MKVQHILGAKETGCHGIAPERPLSEAVEQMMRHRIGALVVREGEQLISIITERDILRAAHERRDLEQTTVRTYMAPRLVCCQAEERLEEAMERMFHNETGQRIRHLPVLDGGQLSGIISIGDIVEAFLTAARYENRLLKNYIRNWPEEQGERV